MGNKAPARPAWHIAPGEYLASRPTEYEVPAQPWSEYLTMRDGCRLAVDVHLPHSGPEVAAGPFPTIAVFTPYFRRTRTTPGSAVENCPNIAVYRDLFVPRGYALVVVDVRGTGASFGTRDSFRSPRERADSAEVADWIVRQPWSDGTLGATGISYLGAASDFLAATGHPAVKAIAPLFSVWDTYADNYFPGGIQLKALTRSYDELMVALDHDRRDLQKNFAYWSHPDFHGPQPVDDDPGGELLARAIREHLGNFRQVDFMPEFRFREEPLPYDPTFSSAAFSPYSLAEKIPDDVAVYSVSGWFDGAGYMNGAISRYLTLADNPRHLLLGPWDHGARIDISPWREDEAPDPAWWGDVLRFFDHYLAGRETGLEAESPVHYYSMHDEQWHATTSWPPIDDQQTFSLAAGHQLAETAAGTADGSAADTHQVDFSTGTGTATRYERIAAVDARTYYATWQGRTDDMLSYTSDPLTAPLALAGHAIADLWISATEPDAALFAYLTEIEADGTHRYVTEGLLRLLHRREAPAPPNYRTTWPYRTFRREDAEPLTPGEPERIRLPLLPTAWQFATGSRIRLSITGADADHCAQVPHGRPPELTVLRDSNHVSTLHLPASTSRD